MNTRGVRSNSLLLVTFAALVASAGCSSSDLGDDAASSTAAVTEDDFDQYEMVEVVCQGVRWKVATQYVGPVGIGEAEQLAEEAGTELPSPELVDAIWKAADLKLAPLTESPNLGDDPAQLERHRARLAQQLQGKAFELVAGNYKDVVRRSDGKIGLYGWQRADGTPIQPFFGGHSPDWKDYSQGLRLVKRIGPVSP